MCELTCASRSSGRAPLGWTPEDPKGVPSARRPGMLTAAWDAYRGKPEREDGQPLTAVQIDLMAPSLAESFGLSEAETRANLEQVQLFLGGPAAHTPWNAVTIGHDIYVRSQDELKAMEDWRYRRWLSHECGHVMQYAKTPTDLEETPRVRQYLGAYVGHIFVGENWWRPGALVSGVGHRLHENYNPWNQNKTHIKLQDALHDTHVMESEAERAAQAFLKSVQ